MVDGNVDIVDHGRQHVEPTAVGAADDGIAGQPGVEVRRAANEVGPFDYALGIQPEPPVRALAVRLQPCPVVRRSEEHTSELQSLMRISYAVFCLKNKKQTINHILSILLTKHKRTKTGT